MIDFCARILEFNRMQAARTLPSLPFILLCVTSVASSAVSEGFTPVKHDGIQAGAFAIVHRSKSVLVFQADAWTPFPTKLQWNSASVTLSKIPKIVSNSVASIVMEGVDKNVKYLDYEPDFKINDKAKVGVLLPDGKCVSATVYISQNVGGSYLSKEGPRIFNCWMEEAQKDLLPIGSPVILKESGKVIGVYIAGRDSFPPHKINISERGFVFETLSLPIEISNPQEIDVPKMDNTFCGYPLVKPARLQEFKWHFPRWYPDIILGSSYKELMISRKSSKEQVREDYPGGSLIQSAPTFREVAYFESLEKKDGLGAVVFDGNVPLHLGECPKVQNMITMLMDHFGKPFQFGQMTAKKSDINDIEKPEPSFAVFWENGNFSGRLVVSGGIGALNVKFWVTAEKKVRQLVYGEYTIDRPASGGKEALLKAYAAWYSSLRIVKSRVGTPEKSKKSS